MYKIAFTMMFIFFGSLLSAETKVSVYSVPFGMVGDVNEQNFRAFNKRLDNYPPTSFALNENDTVLSGDGITIVLDNKNERAENFNRLLAALLAYSQKTPGVDSNAVRQAVGVLAIKHSEE